MVWQGRIIEFGGGEKCIEPLSKEGRASIAGRCAHQIFWPSSQFPGVFGSASGRSETGCGLAATQGVMSSSARMHESTPRSECSCITFSPHCSPVLCQPHTPSFLSYFFSRTCIYLHTVLPLFRVHFFPLFLKNRLKSLIFLNIRNWTRERLCDEISKLKFQRFP